MRRIAHISDLHFNRVDWPVVDSLVETLNGEAYDLIVVSGDLTQGARNSEFVQAKAFLDRIDAPKLCVVGNHDITPYALHERFAAPYRRFCRHISPSIEPVWRDDEMIVVGVNTARRMTAGLNWSFGRVSHHQMEAVEHLLAEVPADLYRIVVGHHPFLPPEWDADARLVKRAAKALAVFERAGVGLVLAGHLHRGYSRFAQAEIEVSAAAGGRVPDLRGVSESSAPLSTRRLMVVQAGSATSTRLRGEPNAYNHILVDGGLAIIEPRLWDGRLWCPATGLF